MEHSDRCVLVAWKISHSGHPFHPCLSGCRGRRGCENITSFFWKNEDQYGVFSFSFSSSSQITMWYYFRFLFSISMLSFASSNQSSDSTSHGGSNCSTAGSKNFAHSYQGKSYNENWSSQDIRKYVFNANSPMLNYSQQKELNGTC